MKGIFGSMFDLNHDGSISPLESAMEFTFLNELLKDDSDVQTELELSGLDPDELEFMDADERREVCLCCKALLCDLVNTDIFILLGTENLNFMLF